MAEVAKGADRRRRKFGPGNTIPAANIRSKGSGKRIEVFIRFDLH